MSNSEYITVSVSQIIVPKKRQRQDLGALQELVISIQNMGVINPITITRDMVLIAGERRLQACKLIDPEYQIPARYIDTLPEETQLLEYEENAKRKNLEWQENALAVYHIHQLMLKREPGWNTTKTGEKLGYSQQHISKLLTTAEELLKDNKVIQKAETLNQAVSVLSRQAKREADNFLNSLVQNDLEPVTELQPVDIIQGDFNEWAPTYNGPKFNFLHCDFPYGINHDKSAQGGTATGRHEGYADSEDVYWTLLKTLANNLDRLLLPSAHVMFWFSMKFYGETIDFIQRETDLELVTPFPLIWHKSDGKGIVPDVSREPRRIYETALLLSRGDRRIIKPVSNLFPYPKGDYMGHVSEKPASMLHHFFELFVDKETEMLDPTCGGGTSIQAAHALNAKRALGLDINPAFVSDAKSGLLVMQTGGRLLRDGPIH